MKNNNGFSFIEIIVSVSVILAITSLAIPIGSKLQAERQKLSDRRLFGQILHDELQKIIHGGKIALPAYDRLTIRNRELYLSFTRTDGRLEGCAIWENARKKQESICLYGVEQ